jgi:hypothetical protein
MNSITNHITYIFSVQTENVCVEEWGRGTPSPPPPPSFLADPKMATLTFVYFDIPRPPILNCFIQT